MFSVRYGKHESDQSSTVTTIVATGATLLFTGSMVCATGVGATVMCTIVLGRKILHRYIPRGII
jgi:hypothetical protein